MTDFRFMHVPYELDPTLATRNAPCLTCRDALLRRPERIFRDPDPSKQVTLPFVTMFRREVRQVMPQALVTGFLWAGQCPVCKTNFITIGPVEVSEWDDYQTNTAVRTLLEGLIASVVGGEAYFFGASA